MLKIKNFKVENIVKGVSFNLKKGETIALMGPNGSGKSTLAQALMGYPYKTEGTIILDGKEIQNLKPNERAKTGLFLSFQYPSEIEGVTVRSFLRNAYIAQKGNISVLDFHRILKEKLSILKMNESFMERYVNYNFSGGEKKRLEILQLAILEPKYAILDETDSGLDIDALKTISEGINQLKHNMGILLITHYTRILNYIEPNKVLILKEGLIVKEGTKDLAHEIESKGYFK